MFKHRIKNKTEGNQIFEKPELKLKSWTKPITTVRGGKSAGSWDPRSQKGAGFGRIKKKRGVFKKKKNYETLDQTWKKFVSFRDPSLEFIMISAKYPTKNQQFRHFTQIDD